VTEQVLEQARLEGGGWEEIEGEVRRADGKEDKLANVTDVVSTRPGRERFSSDVSVSYD